MSKMDSDLLRTFVAVSDAGSVTEGAERIFRSQSATSLQIKRLESLLGRAVFERHGRGVVLTDTGRRLLPVARDVTARLDDALRDIVSDGLQGKLRVGIPDDHGRAKLAAIIGAFARSHPRVELEVICTLSGAFPEQLKKGRIDLAVYEVEEPTSAEEVLVAAPTCWAASAYRNFIDDDTLPVALFDHACWWRDAAVKSLRQRGKPYRVVYSSQSTLGVLAAVEAGVAVGLLARSNIGDGLVVLDEESGFSQTPVSNLVLGERATERSAAADAMKSAIRAAYLKPPARLV